MHRAMAAREGGQELSFQVLRVLAAATFLIFFQAYMVAPLLPRLAEVFGVPVVTLGFIVPAYLIPYGAATLVHGPLSDRLGRQPVILGCMAAFVLLTGVTAAAHSWSALFWLRLLTGASAGGVVPISLALAGDLFPYHQRGQALGWLFGAMAGGMAFGSTAGALLEPFLGWRRLFLVVSVLAACVWGALLAFRSLLATRAPGTPPVTPGKLLAAMAQLLRSPRAARTYGYVLFNAVIHSGTYTWLGLYFAERHRLTEVGIGLALLGYGLPGLVLGPAIGRLADRHGRRWIIPAGLGISGLSAVLLSLDVPLPVAALLVTILSLGYDMTQPLLAGIVTDLTPNRGLAIGLNAFALFSGFGLGSLIFSRALRLGLAEAYALFGAAGLMGALLAVPLFRTEKAPEQGR